MSKQPPPAPTASTIGPSPTIIQIVGRPGTGSSPRTIAPPDPPPWKSERCSKLCKASNQTHSCYGYISLFLCCSSVYFKFSNIKWSNIFNYFINVLWLKNLNNLNHFLSFMTFMKNFIFTIIQFKAIMHRNYCNNIYFNKHKVIPKRINKLVRHWWMGR